MAKKDIKKKPNKRVTDLGSPTRGSNNHKMTATWKVPSSMTKDSSDRRATKLDIEWTLTLADTRRIGGYVQRDTKTLSKEANTSVTSSTINLNSLTIGGTTYTRQSFFPNSKRILSSVTVKVRGKNKKGRGEWATATRTFKAPREPSISAIAFNTSNGVLSSTITTNAGADYQERYDTRYRASVRTRTGSWVAVADTHSTNTSISVSYDASDYSNLTYDQYIEMVVEATARGYAGESDTVRKTYYLAYPKRATIESIDVTSTSGQCIVNIDTNKTTEHPIDSVELQYLANVTYAKVSDIPNNAVWEDSGIVDNANCKALAMAVSTLAPDAGKYSYVRVKSTRANLVRYSNPKSVAKLHIDSPTAEDDKVKIISVTPKGDSAVVKLGWNADNQDDSTGTELSWSDEEDAWKSTEDPSKYDFTWSDGTLVVGSTTYHDSATITIKNLEEGTKYFIKARRYLNLEDSVSYGKYSNVATALTYEQPEAVVASCDKYVAAGDPLSVYWTFTGKSLQKKWQIKRANGTIIASGNGSIGATQISAARLASMATSNSLTFTVQVSTGSDFVSSESHTVTILQKPTLTLTAPATMTAQPYSFTAASSRQCDLSVIVTSQGASGQFPQGFRTQVSGDTIYSDVISPVWSNGSATITLPTCDFWDLGTYTLSVVAIDRETKLKSDEAVTAFTVAWTNQAVDPDEAITLVPMDWTLDGGEHTQAVQIKLTPPTGSNSSDVYDIYRMDGDNAHLVGEGFPLTCTVTDRYAPFGDDVYYRIAIRTIDGDVEFADKEYELISDTIRFDWQGGFLELPYGNSMGDSYRKDVEFRNHLDGTTDGYWNENIERKGSYSSSVIKLIQPDEVNLARALGRYAGAVFVRTANGSAYTADVQVTDLSVKNEAVTYVAFDATEVELTNEFMLPSPFALEDE